MVPTTPLLHGGGIVHVDAKMILRAGDVFY
jgi:hypothetical protein